MIKGLKTFSSTDGLPGEYLEIRRVLYSSLIKKIRCFVLGPKGTNIQQACEKWIREMEIPPKTTVEFGETPEKCLEMARQVTVSDEVAFFWTCAVYYNLYKLFFENPDTLPFFVIYVMPLDEMQLATREVLSEKIVIEGDWPFGFSIASHSSPAPLVEYRSSGEKRAVVKANSNAEAALMCASGKVEGCVTTESARTIHGLVKVHSFGSPPMVFFGGITGHSARVIKEVYRQLKIF